MTGRERLAADPRREQQNVCILDRETADVARERGDLDARGPIGSGEQIRKKRAFPPLLGVPTPRAIEGGANGAPMSDQFLVSDVTLPDRIGDPQGPSLEVYSRNRVVQPLRDRHLIGLERSTLV